MENNLPLSVANWLFSHNLHLLGKKMPPPFSELDITSMSVEKDTVGNGYSVILSHNQFDGVLPNDKAPSVKIDLISYSNSTKINKSRI